MSRQDPDDPFYLDPETAARSEEVLGLLYNNLEVDAPRIFPHEGDTLVFTWDSAAIKRLLSINLEEADLTELSRASDVRAMDECAYDDREQFIRWLFAITGAQMHSGTGTNRVYEESI